MGTYNTNNSNHLFNALVRKNNYDIDDAVQDYAYMIKAMLNGSAAPDDILDDYQLELDYVDDLLEVAEEAYAEGMDEFTSIDEIIENIKNKF